VWAVQTITEIDSTIFYCLSTYLACQYKNSKNTTSNQIHTHTFNGPVWDYLGEPVLEGKTNLDLNEARDSEWQWHQLGHMQLCTSLQTDNHASIPPLSFLQVGCPSCHPTNSIKALKALIKFEVIKYSNLKVKIILLQSMVCVT